MTPFKERMNLYRAYRELNPDKNYWDWKASMDNAGKLAQQFRTRTNKPNFVQRLEDPNRQTIPSWEDDASVATHRLSYATYDDGSAVIYPEVQQIGNELYDFTDPANRQTRKDAYQSALNHGDVVWVPTEQDAVDFTTKYKNHYPTFSKGSPGVPAMRDGGETLNWHEKLRSKLSTAAMNAGWIYSGLGYSGMNIFSPINAAQDSYLVDRKLLQKMFEHEGYTKVGKDYGLVKKAVGNRNLPVFQKTLDAEKRENLTVLGNIDNTWYGSRNTELDNAAHYPSALYVDNDGWLYQKAWDLNDYGKASAGNSIYRYGGVKLVLANMLDKIGSPTVVTTGFQPVHSDRFDGTPVNAFDIKTKYDIFGERNTDVQFGFLEELDNALSKKGLSRIDLGDSYTYGLPEITIKPVTQYDTQVPAMQNGGENKPLLDPTIKTITFPDGSTVQTLLPWANQQGLLNTPVADMLNPANDVYDLVLVGKDATEGNWAGVGAGLALAMVPNAIEKPLRAVGRGIKKRLVKNVDEHVATVLPEPTTTAIARDVYAKDVHNYYMDDVFPRMIDNQGVHNSWIEYYAKNPDNFLYNVQPNTYFRNKNVSGRYTSITDEVALNEDFANTIHQKPTLVHENRHRLDSSIELTDQQTDLLRLAYKAQTGTSAADMREMVATNTEIRSIIYDAFDDGSGKLTPEFINNRIDAMPDYDLLDLVENVNVYGNQYSKNLRNQDGTINKKAIQNVRNALKYVPVLAAPMMIYNTEDKSN